GLVAAHDEKIRVALRVDSKQSADAFAVLVVELDTVLAFDLVVNASLLHLEAGCVNEDVELVLPTLEHGTLLGDLRDALAFGINQVDVGPVEGRQIVVVETRPLA